MDKIKVTLSRVYEYDADVLRTMLIEEGLSNIQPEDLKQLARSLAYENINENIDKRTITEDDLNYDIQFYSKQILV